MHFPRRRTDLAAFLAVLVTGVVLILCGVRAETVSTVAIGLSTLYAAWQRQEGTPRAPDARDASGPRPPDSGDRRPPER
ncbi:hypothetical protein [Streptomyces spectabilis]|uniref:Uncharacterized protein n=1 Tax=Streptomyces spectabilis TaxID=68270 RepID=A0A5P2XLA0_STRST|nr:hypothetical protein [Streptomyces spectabilis]MBB5101984.1 hypothetical protein [Streptomyces spectabilis]MCI3907036.1 hypothetical protein [Streptomyces spectabilis]QEV63810.1 hypothetical protein CP982_38170 [Streptomyces spectabilis]GGV35507.1 hypothetical protein GCM10010245_56930 [Streptomyces spectabilis]